MPIVFIMPNVLQSRPGTRRTAVMHHYEAPRKQWSKKGTQSVTFLQTEQYQTDSWRRHWLLYPWGQESKFKKICYFWETRRVVGILINDQDISKLGTTSITTARNILDLSRNEKSFSLNLGICPTRRTTVEEYNSFAWCKIRIWERAVMLAVLSS